MGHDKPIELWAGIECTVNRVDDRYFNQIERSGHKTRPEDIERFAALGIRALRYPVLWEIHAPHGPKTADWAWADERLALIRRFGIRPIAGLTHHGSGPRHLSLVDPLYAESLADYAAAVAERYPWIEDYTPVNEPLTTARFSALYGVWYPHERDDALFARALVNECRATALSMRAIRRVNAKARLVQTEDLGTVSGASGVAYQAAYENIRRWLSFDLLFGRVNREHPLWNRLRLGVTEEELEFFLREPCPPDVIGINYYVTSDRFLDDRLERYPESLWGGNERDRYVDIEAVRVPDVGIAGHYAGLMAAWERYERPIAVTEVHIDSTREDQLRWLREAWESAKAARRAGADVRAVTTWALLGSFDWNSLVTRDAGYYESGVFDLRGKSPRPTALAPMVRGLARDGFYEHPVLEGPGWWRRSCGAIAGREAPAVCRSSESAPPILITGGTGTLGRAFARSCESRGLAHKLLGRAEMDIADPLSVRRALEAYRPWAVVNAAGYVRVDDAESQIERCWRENTLGAEILAKACNDLHASFVTFSSDLVFDGKQPYYTETDLVAPLNVYGKSKAEAEKRVMLSHPGAMVVRTSAFFGPWDEYNFLTQAMRSWSRGETVRAAKDLFVTPTYVPDLVRTVLDLLIDAERGIWHIANPDRLSWAEFAARLAKLTGYPDELVEACDGEAFEWAAERPKCSALKSERGRFLPPLEKCLERYLKESEFPWVASMGGRV